MPKLFEATQIKGITLANRFVRSATWEGMAAEDGACTPRLVEYMGQLAKGKVGLIISSHAYVLKDGQAGPWQLGVYSDELLEGLRAMTDKVHEQNGRIVLQLAHAGFFANRKLTGQAPPALSAVEEMSKSPRRILSREGIGEIVRGFGEAARRGKEAGFDGVQIHAAHGYLLSQSLSPLFNRREDEYGGSVSNRARFLLEVLGEVKRTVGPDYPVLVKMNCEDFVDGGLSREDSMKTAVMLQEGGIDAIELSGGTFVSGKLNPSRMGISREEKEAYFKEAAKAFKSELHVPLILVGGIRSLEVAERMITDGFADYVSMSRPFICEPDLVARWQSGDAQKAECLSDNLCFGAGRAGEGIRCVTADKKIAGS